MPSHELMNPSTESAGFAMLHINPHGVARTISPRRNTGETVSLPGSVCFPATAYQQTYMNRLHSPHSPSPPRQELLSSTLISPNNSPQLPTATIKPTIFNHHALLHFDPPPHRPPNSSLPPRQRHSNARRHHHGTRRLRQRLPRLHAPHGLSVQSIERRARVLQLR